MSASKRPASKSADAKPRPKKPRNKQTRKHALTPQEREFCAYVAQGVSLREAARESGLNEKNVGHIIKRPLVIEHIQVLKTEIAKDDARRVSALANISRPEIIGRLVYLAMLNPMVTRGIGGQVTALMGLAKIKGMLIDSTRNLDEFFRGWTEEEYLEYATTGNVPTRFAASESEGEADVGTKPKTAK